LIVTHPITVSEYKNKIGQFGYKVEPWLKTTTEDMFIINLNDIITMSESSNIEMIMMYQSYVRQCDKLKSNESKLNRKMGYISNIDDAKKSLEKLYKNN
jgi:hypothetical protein